MFVKNYNHRYIQLINNGAADLYANFDIQDGVIGNYGSSTTASIEDYGNGWYRCSIVCDGSENINARNRVYLADSLTQGYANQTNVALGNGVYIWGAMQENNASYPTSYIPNHSDGSVTRGADDVDGFDISSMIPSSSFTWFLDLNDYIGSDINSPNFWLQSTSSGIYIEFRVRPDGYRFYYNNIAGGSAYPIAGSTTANKFCVSYDGSNYRLYVDGVLQATTASVGDSGWDKIRNQMADASLPLKEILLFSTALSDAQCSALTVEGLKEEILTSYIAAVDTLEDGAEARLDTYLQNLEDLIV